MGKLRNTAVAGEEATANCCMHLNGDPNNEGRIFLQGEMILEGYARAGTVKSEAVIPASDEQVDIEEQIDLEALKAQYKEKFGKLPHYKWSAEKIQKAIDDAS